MRKRTASDTDVLQKKKTPDRLSVFDKLPARSLHPVHAVKLDREAAVFRAHARGVAVPLRRLPTRDLSRLTAQLHSCAGAPSRKCTVPLLFRCWSEESVAALRMPFRRANLVSRLREIVTDPRGTLFQPRPAADSCHWAVPSLSIQRHGLRLVAR